MLFKFLGKKACVADGHCLAAVFRPPGGNSTAGYGSVSYGNSGGAGAGAGVSAGVDRLVGPQPGECFGLHVTSVPGHSDEGGGLSVNEVL